MVIESVGEAERVHGALQIDQAEAPSESGSVRSVDLDIVLRPINIAYIRFAYDVVGIILQIEKVALSKETDTASKERLTSLDVELQELSGQSATMKRRWEAEKQGISAVRHPEGRAGAVAPTS